MAALAATSAFAQSTVTLSGRASMDVSTYSATGSTAGAGYDLQRRTRVADTASRIIFAATEDLGKGRRAGVYCETGINIDTANANGQAATANANTSEWCSREGRAFIGQGDYELRFGRQNVWWTQGELNQIGSTFLGSDAGTNLINGGVGVFGVRLENMVKGAVTRGAFAGSEVYYGFMNANESTVAGTNQPNGPTNATSVKNAGDAKGKYQGFKLSYTKDKIVGMIDHQSSSDAVAAVGTGTNAGAGTAAGTNSFDRSSWKYGVAFKYAPTSLVSFQYWTKKRTDVTTSGASFVTMFNPTVLNTGTTAQHAAVVTAGDAKDSGYVFGVKHDMGGGLMLHGQYSKANNIKGTSAGEQANTGATAYTLGATYSLSKRTHLYGAYHRITNQANAAYNMTGGNYASGTSANGADIKMMALGMQHNF